MRDIINNLSNGFEKVELTNAEYAKVFNKTMNIDEAKNTFYQFIENQCVSKAYEKIRTILIKNKE